jgi:hypothetical protein
MVFSHPIQKQHGTDDSIPEEVPFATVVEQSIEPSHCNRKRKVNTTTFIATSATSTNQQMFLDRWINFNCWFNPQAFSGTQELTQGVQDFFRNFAY